MRYLAILFSLLLMSCSGSSKNKTKDSESSCSGIRYAKGFKVDTIDGYLVIEVTDPTKESLSVYRYVLVEKESADKPIPAGCTAIKVPIEKVVCMTTLQLSAFIRLEATNQVAGITSTRFLKNKELNSRLNNGSLRKIGIEGEFDAEVIYDIAPDLILTSPFKRGGYESIDQLNVPMLSYLGYKEPTPLGQAEWIKLVGMLTGRESEADSIFSHIEKRYNELINLTKGVEKRPTILSGELHSGNWYVVGGRSYLAQLFRDAGADYFMQNDSESGGFYVDFESVYSQGHNADYWRIANNYNGEFSYDVLDATDSRYRDFKAFKDKRVIYCNLRQKPFYENTPMEPDVVLSDLIKIFHPSLLPNHEAVYYQLLE